MSNNKEEKKIVSRRDFIKGAAVVAGGGVLASCAPKIAGTPTAELTTAAAVAPGAMTAAQAAQKWSFEIPPDPIPDSQIANTVTADIIVVGAGTSGLVCANSAAENGAKVVLISGSKGNIARGGSNHAMNSKTMQAANFPIPDTNEFFRRELAAVSYDVDQDKWWKFANNSEEAMNWLIDKMEAAGYQTVLEIGYTDPNNGPMDMPVGSHSWISKDMTMAGSGQQFVVDTLAKTAQAAGVQVIYQTVAEQLVRENNNTGRVTAVIAKGTDGTYTKYVGTKGIVLATGDFSADKDMMTKYCPMALPLLNNTGDQGYDTGLKVGGLYKGDGQKMGLWVGAAWQKTFPNPPMILVGPGGSGLPAPQPYGGHSGLLINKNGYRYGNEDNTCAYAALTQMHQPDLQAYAIWGTNYAEGAAPWYSFGMIRGADPVAPADMLKSWDAAVNAKTMVKGNTVEEVIAALGLPADATKATVDRYNGFCKSGVDADYHKRKELLVPIDTAPFYGAAGGAPTFLTVMGGLRTNLNMQVCDENDQPIPGLFNVGTMVGDYFANAYNFIIQGNNLGTNCVTYGYLTGRAIAKGEI